MLILPANQGCDGHGIAIFVGGRITREFFKMKDLVLPACFSWPQRSLRSCFHSSLVLMAGMLALGFCDSTAFIAQAQRDGNSGTRAHENQPAGAQSVQFSDLSSGRYRDRLVSISGVLLSEVHDADSTLLSLEVEGHLVHASLVQKAAMSEYEPGSTLRVAGNYRMAPEGFTGYRLPYLELRNDGDVVLAAMPSFLTFPHKMAMFGVLVLVVAAYSIRSAFLRWRVVHQAAWVARSLVIARERTRILEMIGSDLKLDEMLGEVCKSVMELLPGVVCEYALQSENGIPEGSRSEVPPESREKILYEVSLKDDRGETNGTVIAYSNEPHAPHGDQAEIFNLLAELSSLAMRQSLLYRGLVYHSTHDPLTELPNRRLCESHLASMLKEAEETNGRLAVIYIDINRFKYVNDKYGHKTGDLYLQQISARLRAQLRSIDMLARVGGDEFVVIAPFPEYFDRANAISARLQACFQDPFSLDGILIDGSASFGFARYPEHGLTVEDLTRHADHEMYIAKHETHISEEAHGLAIITVSELELALLNGSFRLAYQPQFSAAGHLTGLEALLRLDDPVLGLLTPDAFISIAEQNRVIVDIGAWALRSALRDASRWGLNRGDTISLAINVSVRQLEEPGYAKSVLTCLQEYGFPPNRLEIELIERSLMFSGDQVKQQLEQLRMSGVRITLDDFGTEQSCLSLLHKLPIDTIKLDRSFIRAMDTEPTVLPIIQAIVSMAQSLGKRIVAEAIEHVGPVPALMKMGKMDFQGYLLSRPVAAEEMSLVIDTWRSGITMPEPFRDVSGGRITRVS